MTLQMSFGQLGWGDSDTGTGYTGGWIGLDNLQISTLHMWPRTDFTMEPAAGGVPVGSVAVDGDGGWADLKMITIDVLTTTADDFDDQPGVTTLAYTTKVKIGVPTLTITMKEMTGNVVLGARTNTESVGGAVNGIIRYGKQVNGPEFDQVMGRFYVAGLNMALGGGDVYIYAHGSGTRTSAAGNTSSGGTSTMYGSGVTIEMSDVTVSYLLLDKAAWGDLDGAKEYGYEGTSTTPVSTNGIANPGWVGLADLTIKNIVLNGKVFIDVASISTTGTDQISAWTASPTGPHTWTDLLPCYDEIYTATLGTGQNKRTFVQISFDNFTMTMEKMYARAVLNMDAAGLAGPLSIPDTTDQVLGDIYIGGMSLTIGQNELTKSNSYVRIFAH